MSCLKAEISREFEISLQNIQLSKLAVGADIMKHQKPKQKAKPSVEVLLKR